MSIKEQLINQINAGKITFDNNSIQLKQQLLQEIAGQLINENYKS